MSIVSSLCTHSKLLQHPLVESYVLANWARLRCFFLIISLIQFTFVLSLSVYIMFWVHVKEQVRHLLFLLKSYSNFFINVSEGFPYCNKLKNFVQKLYRLLKFKLMIDNPVPNIYVTSEVFVSISYLFPFL